MARSTLSVRITNDVALGRALRALRKASGVTQTVLARRLGTTQSSVAQIEAARTNILFRTVVRYAAALGYRTHVRLERRR